MSWIQPKSLKLCRSNTRRYTTNAIVTQTRTFCGCIVSTLSVFITGNLGMVEHFWTPISYESYINWQMKCSGLTTSQPSSPSSPSIYPIKNSFKLNTHTHTNFAKARMRRQLISILKCHINIQHYYWCSPHANEFFWLFLKSTMLFTFNSNIQHQHQTTANTSKRLDRRRLPFRALDSVLLLNIYSTVMSNIPEREKKNAWMSEIKDKINNNVNKKDYGRWINKEDELKKTKHGRENASKEENE